MYNGEEVLVGKINKVDNVYVYTDFLFENINPIKNTSSFEDLKDMIGEYYSDKDTIGKIEEKYPYLF